MIEFPICSSIFTKKKDDLREMSLVICVKR